MRPVPYSSPPIFEQAAAANPDMVFAKVDTESQAGLAGALDIMSIPTLMIFREQVLVFSSQGALPRPLDDLIAQVRASTWTRSTGPSPSSAAS